MEIKISKCRTMCCACDTEFTHQQEVYSRVVVAENTLERRDYCSDCAQNNGSGTVFCAWTIRYNDPRVKETERQETLSPLRRLFYDAAASSERADLARAYLAAQLLRRQKVFRQIKESDESDGAERVTLFLDRAGNRLIEARDLNFSYAELDEAGLLLMEDLRALETPESEAAPESTENADKHVKTTTT